MAGGDPAAAARRILAAATQLGALDSDEAAAAYARARDWLDAAGEPTPAGLAFLEAVASQRQTRSVFRGLA